VFAVAVMRHLNCVCVPKVACNHCLSACGRVCVCVQVVLRLADFLKMYTSYLNDYAEMMQVINKYRKNKRFQVRHTTDTPDTLTVDDQCDNVECCALLRSGILGSQPR
jgi:hypothetical protein